MDDEARTPLGELLVTWRRQLGLSQKELADRTVEMTRHDDTVGPVSVRTIVSLERPVSTSGARRRPRRDTAHSLAVALELQVGSPGYLAFMDAAQRPAAATGSSIEDHEEPASGAVIEAGRERPLYRIASALDIAAGGTPSAVLVRGEPGSGKTTLIAHACRLALDRHPGTVVLWVQARAEDPSHGVFRRIVRLMLGDPDGSAANAALPPAILNTTAARAGVAAETLAAEGPLLVAVSLTPEDRDRPLLNRSPDRQVTERLAHLAAAAPDDSLGAVSGGEQFYRAIRRYAAVGPVVLVIDDLHEADPATLASLDYLVNHIHQRHDLPLAIVAACLPEGQINGETDGLNHLLETIERLYPHGSIDLTATLAEPAARAFAEAVLDRASLTNDLATVDALIERTGGNPRYLTSVVNALQEHAGAGSDIASAIDTTVPSEIAPPLAARVGRLPQELQRILMVASVLGHDFHAETLMRMLDLSLSRFIELVDRQLWRRHGLLRADGTSVIGGRVMHTYRFRPPLLRDAIYQGLSDLERTHAHGRAADVLVELHGDTQHGRLERLAHHLERAGRRDEAARIYLRAGELARTQRDFDTARRMLERGTELGTQASDPETRIRTLISLGLCERSAGNSAAARTHLTRALGLTSTWRNDTLEATTLEALGMVDFDTGEMARGRDRILRAVDIWATHDVPDTSRALANLSYLLSGLGRYDEAIASAERARIEATRSRQTGSWIDGTIGLANCLIDLGRYDRAAELHEHALLIGSELGDLHRQRICWINLALIAVERGDWGAAELAIDRVDRGGDPLTSTMEGVVAFHRGLIAEGQGNGALAGTHYRHARELRDSKGQEALAIDAVAGELRIAMADEDHELASTLLDDLERRLDARGRDGVDGVEHPGRLYVTLIEAAQALGRTELAREHARAAVGFLTERSTHVPDADREGYLSGVSSHRRILELAVHLRIVAG